MQLKVTKHATDIGSRKRERIISRKRECSQPSKKSRFLVGCWKFMKIVNQSTEKQFKNSSSVYMKKHLQVLAISHGDKSRNLQSREQKK